LDRAQCPFGIVEVLYVSKKKVSKRYAVMTEILLHLTSFEQRLGIQMNAVQIETELLKNDYTVKAALTD
jgi:hypothetical protein